MTTTYAGMDAHARAIHVAVLAAEGGRPEEWQLTNEPRSVKRLAQRLKRMAPGPVVACYEAGPGGFALQRQLEGVEERLRTLEQELAVCAASDDYREAVGLLRCFRGVDTVTAMTVGAALRKRREGQPGWAVVLADRAQARLYRRHRRLAAHGKPSVVANTAVARELAGYLWAVLRRIPASAGGPKAGAREQTAA